MTKQEFENGMFKTVKRTNLIFNAKEYPVLGRDVLEGLILIGHDEKGRDIWVRYENAKIVNSSNI